MSIHDIFRLDISVNDTLGMTMLKSLEKIQHDFSSFLFREWFFSRGDFLKEFTSCTKLHTEVNVLAVIICFVVLNDVWMINLLHKFDLIF